MDTDEKPVLASELLKLLAPSTNDKQDLKIVRRAAKNAVELFLQMENSPTIMDSEHFLFNRSEMRTLRGAAKLALQNLEDLAALDNTVAPLIGAFKDVAGPLLLVDHPTIKHQHQVEGAAHRIAQRVTLSLPLNMHNLLGRTKQYLENTSYENADTEVLRQIALDKVTSYAQMMQERKTTPLLEAPREEMMHALFEVLQHDAHFTLYYQLQDTIDVQQKAHNQGASR